MRIGLTGLPGSGKSTVFSALTGIDAGAGHRRGRDGVSIGTVKVPDSRVDALALIYRPRKVVYAELSFTDLGGGRASGLDRGTLHAMRDMDALCHVLRAFPGASDSAPDPAGELETLETEALLADLEVIEQRVERLRKEGKKTPELALLAKVSDALESETALRDIGLGALERKPLSGFGLLTLKPLLVAHNVAEDDIGRPPPPVLLAEAAARGAGVVTLSALVETDIAQMEGSEQQEFVESLGLGEPARDRFIRAAFALTDLISMITVGPEESGTLAALVDFGMGELTGVGAVQCLVPEHQVLLQRLLVHRGLDAAAEYVTMAKSMVAPVTKEAVRAAVPTPT